MYRLEAYKTTEIETELVSAFEQVVFELHVHLLVHLSYKEGLARRYYYPPLLEMECLCGVVYFDVFVLSDEPDLRGNYQANL